MVSLLLPFDGALGAAPVKEHLESLSTVGTVTVGCTTSGGGYACAVTFDTNAGNVPVKCLNGALDRHVPEHPPWWREIHR